MTTPDPYEVALVGAPNCGKSTVFNRLAGLTQRVGNFPGVTVERKEGRATDADGHPMTVVDLPGLYGLTVHPEDDAPDQAIARDHLLSGQARVVVNVLDATRLEQGLYLTLQILETGVPVVVAVNMMDALHRQGDTLDTKALADALGCPVVPLAAARNEGVDDLKAAVTRLAETGSAVDGPTYPDAVEKALGALAPFLAETARTRKIPERWLAVKLLEGDAMALASLTEPHRAEVVRIREEAEAGGDEDTETLIADARFDIAHHLAQQTVKRAAAPKRGFSDRLDQIVLHPILGIPLFLGVMYALFTFTINIGGAFIDFFDIAAGALFIDGVGRVLDAVGAPAWLTVVLADGLGGGLQVVATFIPVVGALFLALTLLEDTGYMARAAFMLDRFMTRIGLPGKALVPLIVGFGCNVPSVMGARTLERHHDRVLTAAMAPFMSCGARLAVYALFVAAFFPTGGQNIVFLLYLIGVLVAVLTALLLQHTLVRGEPAAFVLDLPRYHLPRVRDLLLHTWSRLHSFLVHAGKVIVLVVMVLGVLNAVGTNGEFGIEDADKSVLSASSRMITPAFAPMGIQEDNWPAVVGIITGVFAKEAVVGTLDTLYGDPEGDAAPGVLASLGEAVATIPANLAGVGALLLDPLDLGSLDSGAEEVTTTTMTTMKTAFDGTVGAFAYLLFVLLYVPCVAVLGALYRELGWRWMAFVGVWTTSVAYVVATLAYQVGTFGRHPGTSTLWIGGMVVVSAAVALIMRRLGNRQAANPALMAAE